MGKTKIIKELKDFKENLKKDFPDEKIILFGSRALGREGPDSDVDLIIVSKKFREMNFIKRASRMYDYWNLNYPVDFLCYTPDEFTALKKRISIVSEAMKEGIVI